MKPPSENFKESLVQSRQELTEALRGHTPAAVVEKLEKSGWSREWACAAVETVEYRYNPASLMPDARRNQEIRQQLQSRSVLGSCLFIVGLVVSLGTLAIAISAGGLVIIAYGSVFVGASMWLKAYPQLKRYPDRPMPKYVPPRDSRVHDPGNF